MARLTEEFGYFSFQVRRLQLRLQPSYDIFVRLVYVCALGFLSNPDNEIACSLERESLLSSLYPT